MVWASSYHGVIALFVPLPRDLVAIFCRSGEFFRGRVATSAIAETW
jgi:hypothetical protein